MEEDEKMKQKKKEKKDYTWVFWVLALVGVVLLNSGDVDSYIDSYVQSCDLDKPYACLDASFNEGKIEIAMYGEHEDVMVEGCAHMAHREHDNGLHVVDIYSFSCAIGDRKRDIFIDGERQGRVVLTDMTGW